MADKSFDVVIVGGGNKALATAMYLTKYGGLSVGIFENRHELGGGWSSEEPAPGFQANTCSSIHLGFYHLPVYEDIPEWETYGARYVYTDVSMGVIYEEDDSCVTIYSAFDDVDPDQERTAQEFSRFSKKDAENWLYYWEKSKKYWRPAMNEWMFSPAPPNGVPDALEKLIQNPDAGIKPIWMAQTPLQVYQDIFETPEVAHTFARVMQSWGFQSDQSGAGLGAILFVFYGNAFFNYVVGGTHQLAHASQRVILENGGSVFTRHPVEKIMIENGKAGGIRLADGTEIEAKKAVVSSVDPYQLCFDLVGEEYLSSDIMRKVKMIDRHWICINWYTWALKEPPRYRAESFNPDIYKAQLLSLGDKDLKTFMVESLERKMGKWPSKVNLMVSYHGGDPSHLIAPPGNDCTFLTEQFVLPADALSEKEWKKWEHRHAEEVVETVQRYAPNMTWDNVIDYTPVNPYYTAHQCKNYAPAGNWAVIDHTPSQLGRFRPIPELAGHRTPVKSLYATGAAWHPFAGGSTMQGYNCYKVMAEDFDLKKPWEDKGRPY